MTEDDRVDALRFTTRGHEQGARAERVRRHAERFHVELVEVAYGLRPGQSTARYWTRRPKNSVMRRRVERCRRLIAERGPLWSMAEIFASQRVEFEDVLLACTFEVATADELRAFVGLPALEGQS